VLLAQFQLLERAARRALPPAAGALSGGAGDVREQLPDGAAAQRRPGHVPVQRIVEVQPALVAQPQHRDRGHRLADRAQPVLDVGVRLGHRPAPGRPRQPAVPDHAGDQARRPPVPLHAGHPGEQLAGGGRQDGIGHDPER
jgi:hypothetical protein